MPTPERLHLADLPGAATHPALERRLRVLRWAWIFIFGVAFVLVSAWSWRRWPDILVDYGLQLYMPWQLSTGKVLYRDVAYLAGGPLSQYYHAILFKIFGVSLTTLIGSSLCLLALFFVLLFRLFERAADMVTALLILIVVLFTFAFSHESLDGNYNYICPYSYETVHGLYLSVLTIAFLCRWLGSGRRLWAALAGLGYGCVFLTKPDLFLALTLTMGAAVGMQQMRQGRWTLDRLKPLVPMALAFAVPSLLIVAYYAVKWNVVEGFKAAGGAWLPLLTTHAAHNKFYEWCLGLDRPGHYIVLTLRQTGYFAATICFLILCARYMKRNLVFAVGLGVLAAALISRAYDWGGWHGCGAALLPISAAGLLLVGGLWWQRRDTPRGAELVFPLLWAVFSLFLLAKMGFFTRIWHYGFYLAMPATAFAIYLVAWLLPRELARFGVDHRVFRMLAVAFLAVAIARLATISDFIYSGKIFPVGGGGDLIYTPRPKDNPSGDGVEQTVEWLQQNTTATNTVGVMPEGVMINYQSRRRNPTPYTVFCLPEMTAFGEANMLAAYVKSPPDYIVLVHRDMSEYGVKYFGQQPGFGYDIMKWMRANYSPLWLYGNEPLVTNKFGILMMKRNGAGGAKSLTQ